MQNMISLDTEKLTRRSLQHGGPGPPTGKTGERGLGLPTGSGAYELNTSQIGYESVPWNCVGERRGILAGSWDMCEPKSVGGGDGYPLLPPPWKVGEVSAPLVPLFLRLCDWFSNEVCVDLRCVSVHISQLVYQLRLTKIEHARLGPTGNNATQLDTTGCSHCADYLWLTVELSRVESDRLYVALALFIMLESRLSIIAVRSKHQSNDAKVTGPLRTTKN